LAKAQKLEIELQENISLLVQLLSPRRFFIGIWGRWINFLQFAKPPPNERASRFLQDWPPYRELWNASFDYTEVGVSCSIEIHKNRLASMEAEVFESGSKIKLQ
jgi:hypothetical protein